MLAHPRTAAASSAVVAVVVLAGCGGGSDETDTSAPAQTTSSGPSSNPAVTASPTPAPASALPDAPLTEPGAAVEGSTDLVLPLVATGASGAETELKIQVSLDEVAEGDISDLTEVLSESDYAGLDGWFHPSYVHVSLDLVGTPVPDGFSLDELPTFTGIDTDGGQAAAPELTGAPPSCEPADVDELEATGSTTGCAVMMVSEGSTLAAVEYRGTFHASAVAYTSNPVIWNVAS